MNIVQRGTRAVGASAALVLGLTGAGLVAGPPASADTVMAATTAVNVRAGATTSSAVIGVLRAGGTVNAVAASQNGWTKVSYNGRTAYIYSMYLTAAGTAAAPAAPAASTSTRNATTLEAVNVRTGPSLTSPVSEVYAKGRTITVTTTTSNGYTQLTDGRWISSAWITVAAATPTSTAAPATTAPAASVAPTTPAASTPAATTPPAAAPTTSAPAASTPAPLPAVTGQVRATAALMIRTTSGSDYTNLGDVPAGTILNVTGVTANGVAQVVYNGAVRWVNASYISIVPVAGPAVGQAAKALAFATAQVGKAYAWGGNGPNAYDCSGLTTAAYKSVGITIPRTSYSQFTVGTPVTLANLQPGDLVFYYSDISHVAMYIGNGRIVHAANPSRGVVTDSVTSMPFMGGRRIA